MLHPRDVPGADEGGADRVVCADRRVPGGTSPEPGLVSSICKETELPVRVLLRLNDSHTTTGGELTRLVGLAESYLNVGAEGVVFGFLDVDLLVDVEVCRHLADALPGVPWTFSRALDDSLEADLAWRQVLSLPGLDAVHSAGSPQGLGVGFDDLVDRVGSDPGVARVLMAGGGLARGARAVVAAGRRTTVLRRLLGSAGRLVGQGVRRSRTRACLEDAARRLRRSRSRLGLSGRRDAADRSAERARPRPDVVPPGQRRLLRGAAPLRPRARHPRTRLRPRPLRHPLRPLRVGGRCRRASGVEP